MTSKGILQLAKYRNTPQRCDFIEILCNNNLIETNELKKIFIEKSRANIATFYRLLADFKLNGFIHMINENNKEYIFLCQEVKNGRLPTMKYELTHCHNCGNIEDKHESIIPKNTIHSHKEIHVENCSNCN